MNARNAMLALSLAVVLLVTALGVVAHRSRAVIVVTPTCGQMVYNNGPNYEYRKVRYRWRHV